MARQPREWGNKQLDLLDDLTVNFLDTGDLARGIQVAIRSGDTATALINSGDIRDIAARSIVKIGRARRGEYEDHA